MKGVAPTPTPVGGCKECPSDFACYFNGNEYRWFVTGYVGNGFVPVGGVSCGGIPKPSFRGKRGADANCDGYADAYDYSIWRREYVDLGGGWQGMPPFPLWEADFTGPTGGKCDNKVGADDYSLWRREYLDGGRGSVPTPTCVQRPGCLDNKPPCDVVEPSGGWCGGGGVLE